MDLMIAGKVVLVTGGGSGIGRAAALRFAEEGARVAVCDLVTDAAQETAQTITSAGGHAIAISANVASAKDVDSMVGEVAARYGGLDIAINNAGVGTSGRPLAELSEDDFDRLISINLRSVWLCMRREIPLMLARGSGVIINTASVMGLVAAANSSAYVAAKHGVIGLTKAAALEYSPSGIRINAVCPGIVETPLVKNTFAQADSRARIVSLHPIGRAGQPIDIAEAMVWLASPRASFITGAAIPIDGGWTAH